MAVPIPRYPVPVKKTVVKPQAAPVKKTKPVGSSDPSGSAAQIGGLTVGQLSRMTPQQILAHMAFLQAQPAASVAAPDFSKLHTAAVSEANRQTQTAIQPYQQLRTQGDQRLDSARQSATAFAQAFASIAGGGSAAIDDPVAQKYALDNFGSSYVGGMAAQLGAQLINQQQSYFNEQDAKYVGEIKKIMDARPDLAEKMYKEVADAAAKNYKEGRSAAELDKANQLKALATFAKALGGSSGAGLKYFSQPGGGVLVIDAATGNPVRTIPGTGKAGGAGGGPSPNNITKTKTYNGKVYQWNQASGKFDIYLGASGTGDGSGKSSGGHYAGGTGAYSILNGWTTQSAKKQIIKWRAEASEKARLAAGSAANGTLVDTGTNPDGEIITYQKAIAILTGDGVPLDIAQAALNRYWKPGEEKKYEKKTPGSGRPLKSYQELNPGKGGKRGKTVAYKSVALDFPSLAQAAVGGTATDLGGPSAHYAKHDSGENWQSNNAWDIGVPIGTPIYALTDGRIGSQIGTQSSRPKDGQRLTLDGSSNSFWYAHLSDIVVKAGQRVRAGQLLGYSGASENGAAHLHLAVMNLPGWGSA